MKKTKFILAIVVVATSLFYSCKNNPKQVTPSEITVKNDTVVPVHEPTIVISGDDELIKGVTDAVKDYPNVKANVADSVINLTGEIKRADWKKLNPTLNSLHPKRINSRDLTIKQ